MHIQISLDNKFQLKLTILIFLEQICQKMVFLVKKRKSQHHHWIQYVRICLDAKCQLKLTTLTFCTIWTFWFLVENRKNGHHHWILHIWISLGIKFQFKLTILIFWKKFAQKVYFQSKTEKLNTATEFCVFELVMTKSQWKFDIPVA